MRKIELSFNNRAESFVLPINPSNIEISENNLNSKLTLLNFGEINLIGKRGLAVISLNSFFPAENSPFFKYAKNTPDEYVSKLKKWKNSGKPIRVIITDLDINLAMAIERVSFSRKEGDGDIYYNIDLCEYRFLNILPTAEKTTNVVKSNGLKERHTERTIRNKTYTVKSGESLWTIAKKMLGDGAKYMQIYNANKELIDSRNAKAGAKQFTIYPAQELVI